jgi:hypothetical protein
MTLRVDFGSKRSVGPGKIRLLEESAMAARFRMLPSG